MELTWERTATEVLALVDEVLTRLPNRVASIHGEWEFPSVIDSPMLAKPDAPTVGRGFEWLVGTASRPRAFKRILSPDGSRRQQAMRQFVNWGRRHTGVHANS
jgi:hypothetical protein